MSIHALLFAAATLVAPSPSAELELASASPILPFQGAVLRLTVRNPATVPIDGVPVLTRECSHALRLHVRFEEEEERAVTRPSRPLTSHCASRYRSMRANEVETSRWNLAVDWDSRTPLFDRPGDYTIRAVVTTKGGVEIETDAVTVRVAELTEEQAAAVEALRRIEGWTALHAPDSVRANRDRAKLLDALEAWRAAYPVAPWGAELPLLRAVEADHASIVASLRARPAEARARAQESLAWLEHYAGEPWASLPWRAEELRAELTERLRE